jgi:hypothetical protein
MKSLVPLAGALLVVSSAVGCAGIARSPVRYRDDVTKLVATRHADISRCYGLVQVTVPEAAGKVTVTFDVEPERGEIIEIAIDAPNTTAPLPLAACVKNNLAGLYLSPRDRRTGQASFAYEFAPPPPPPPPVRIIDKRGGR